MVAARIFQESKILRTGFQQINSIIPDIHFTIEESISELDKVFTVWIVEGTHSKDFRGIPATHKKFETAGVNIFHFEGNKIKEAWTIIDGLTADCRLVLLKQYPMKLSRKSFLN